jgi:hypothetical protein
MTFSIEYVPTTVSFHALIRAALRDTDPQDIGNVAIYLTFAMDLTYSVSYSRLQEPELPSQIQHLESTDIQKTHLCGTLTSWQT